MEEEIQETWFEKNKSILVFAGIFLILVILIALIFFVFFRNKPEIQNKKEPSKEETDLEKALKEKKTATSSTGLPENKEKDVLSQNGNGEFSDLEVENIGFG